TTAPLDKPIAIIDGTQLNISHGTLRDATLGVSNGKITKLQPQAIVPQRAEVIDAHGHYDVPGLLDPHSHLRDYSIATDLSAVDAGNEEPGDTQARYRWLD